MGRLLLLAALVASAAVAEPTARSAPADSVELLFVGDVSLAGRRLPKDRDSIAGSANPLRGFADLFGRADLVVANAEGIFTAKDPKPYGQTRLNLWAPPVYAKVFAGAHIGVVGTANNHTFDGGGAGVIENLENLEATGVRVFGSGATRAQAEADYELRLGDKDDGRCVAVVFATTKSNKGAPRGAALAYYPTRNGRQDQLIARVRSARERCELVIAYVHWGRENVHFPTKRVRSLAHRLADAGAAAVVGHHPHVLQGVEFRDGAVIAYSLGNFVFTNRDEKKGRTAVLGISVSTGKSLGISEVSMYPAILDVRGFWPRPAEGAKRIDLLERIRDYSRGFGTVVEDQGDRFVFRR